MEMLGCAFVLVRVLRACLVCLGGLERFVSAVVVSSSVTESGRVSGLVLADDEEAERAAPALNRERVMAPTGCSTGSVVLMTAVAVAPVVVDKNG